MGKIMLLLMCVALCVSTSFANEGVEADDPVGSVAAPVSLRGVWIDPTDDTMENGLSVLAHHWPDYQGSMINYVNIYDPAYGLDPTKEYQITNVQFSIKHKDDNNYDVDESRIIIQEWDGSSPTETNLYEQLIDTDGWGYPEDYVWTDPIAITEPYFVLPGEFAIGWHIYWPAGGGFANWWLGLDEDAPTVNYYYYNEEWRHMTPYDGAFGVRFEVEEVGGVAVETITLGGVKALYR